MVFVHIVILAMQLEMVSNVKNVRRISLSTEIIVMLAVRLAIRVLK